MKQFTNRVRETRDVPASELQENPKNWRVHGQRKLDALDALLQQLGRLGNLTAVEHPETGDLILLNGHARLKVSDPGTVWTVDVLDLSAEEADVALTWMDEMSRLADVDYGHLASLHQSRHVRAFSEQSEALSSLAAIYAPATGGVTPAVPGESGSPLTNADWDELTAHDGQMQKASDNFEKFKRRGQAERRQRLITFQLGELMSMISYDVYEALLRLVISLDTDGNRAAVLTGLLVELLQFHGIDIEIETTDEEAYG